MVPTRCLDLPIPSFDDFWDHASVKQELGPRPRQSLRDIFEGLKDRAHEFMHPRAALATVPITAVEGERVTLADGTVLQGKNVAKVLKGAEEACFYVVTLGPGVDREVDGSVGEPGKLLTALVIGAMGSVVLSKLGSGILDIIRETEAEPRGLGVTCRYSPGQTHWSIREQKKLFAICPGGEIGVRLSESCLMVPTKSISGVVGIGPKEHLSKVGTACELCPKVDCPSRRILKPDLIHA